MIGNNLLPINIFLSTSVTNVKVAEETVKSEEKKVSCYNAMVQSFKVHLIKSNIYIVDKTRSTNWFDHKLPYEYFWGIPGWDKCCASFLPSISYLISYIAIFLQTICAISHIAIFSHTICPISHIAIFSHKVWAIKWHR